MSWLKVAHRRSKCGCLHIYACRLYDRHPRNYISVYTIDRDDGSDIGKITSLNGPGFYALIPNHVHETFEKCGITALFADVLEPNYIAIRRALRKICHIETVGQKIEDGMDFIMIKLTLKETKQ